MTISDTLLRHHNHPVTLLLDSCAAAAAAVLLWQQHLIRAAVVAGGVPLVASALVLAFADTAKLRPMTPRRLAMRVVGAFVLWGGAWWTSPWICAAGAVLIALTIVDVATLETLARRLPRFIGDQRQTTRAALERWIHVIVGALVSLALVDVVVLYFAGHDIRGYLTGNSDLLYLPTLFVDITSKGGRLADWYLTPAPYFFPDYLVFLIAHLLGPSIYIRIAIFAAAQALVTFAAFVFLARSVSRLPDEARRAESGSSSTASNAVIDAAIITTTLTWLGVNAGEPFVILFASASHFGAFICSIVLAALWIEYSTDDGRRTTALAFALGGLVFLATLSDGLFMAEAIVPFVAAAVLTIRAEQAPRVHRWSGLAAAWVLLAAIIPAAVYRVPVAPPNINVNWAPSVTDAQRHELEATFHLSDGDFRGSRLWTYGAQDTTRDNIAAIVKDPRVEDTEHVDRQRFTVDGSAGPLARAISSVPIGLAASTLVVLGLLFVRRRPNTLVILVPICGLLGAWFYDLVIPKHTRYPLSVGFEKVYGNSADLYTLVYRVATGMPLYGILLCAYLVASILLVRDRMCSRGREHYPAALAWIALFSFCSLCATAMTVSLLTDLPVMPRYVIPLFAWPIAVAVLFADRALGARYVTVGTAALAITTGALTYQALAHRSGVTTRFYPPAIACLDDTLEHDGLHNGIAQYWDAKYLQDFSRLDLRIGQYLEKLDEMRWITSEKYFRGTYDFAVVDENAEPTYKISIGALTTINGAPQRMVRCGTRSIYVWGTDRLRVTPAGSPAPAAPQ